MGFKVFSNASYDCLLGRKFRLENTIERHRTNEVREWFSSLHLYLYIFFFLFRNKYFVLSYVSKNDLSRDIVPNTICDCLKNCG